MTPYYTDDMVTLYNGDCLDVLPSLSDVDLIVTSPPYNLGVWNSGKWASTNNKGITYTNHDDAMPYEDYRKWQQDVLTACWATLSETGAIFYNHKPRTQDKCTWLPIELNPGLPLRQVIIWARSGGVNFSPTHYMSTHEWICVFAKPDFHLKSRAASGVGDVWTVSQEANPDHPAPFPIAIPNRAIETTAPSLVLDPFAGSGTTLRAAMDAGVKSIGIEKSERYCEVIAKRLDQGVLAFDTAG